MADNADIASEREAKAWQRWREQRDAMSTGKTAAECDECGGTIPEGRRRAVPGCRLCVDCQQSLSDRQRHYR